MARYTAQRLVNKEIIVKQLDDLGRCQVTLTLSTPEAAELAVKLFDCLGSNVLVQAQLQAQGATNATQAG